MKRKLFFQIIIAYFIVMISLCNSSGQTFSITFDLHELARKNQFETFNRQISWSSADERKVIHLPAGEGSGIAWISGIDFSEGTIELDIRTRGNMTGRSAGIAFHGAARDTLDVVCFGPSDLPSVDTEMESLKVSYLVQPVNLKPDSLENFTNSFEKPINPPDKENGWIHVKISVRGKQINVFVDNNINPVLDREKLNDRKSGRIGFWVSDNSGGDFANLKISTGAGKNLKNSQRKRQQ